jgi:hypothetical protein
MQIATEEYKGFTIAVTPVKDCGDLWDFTYKITRIGEGGPQAALSRSQTAGGHATPDTACVAGVHVARIEIDNLLALAAGGKR